MRGGRGIIHLGDLVEVVGALGLKDAEAVARAARLLGLEEAEPAPGVVVRSLALTPAVRGPAPTTGVPQPASPSQPDLSEGEGWRPVPIVIRRLKAPTSEGPSWATSTEPLEPPTQGQTAETLQPLIGRAELPGVVVASVGAVEATGRPDVAAMVERLASALPVEVIPRERRRTLRRGLDVLVDRGEGMVPWFGDVRGLVERLGLIVPEDTLRVHSFSGSPSRPADAEAGGWRPRAGVPILVLTDLGVGLAMGPRATAEEWLTFARACQAAETSAVLLVPHAPWWWPPSLMPHLQIVPWSEQTRVQQVRRFLGARRPVPSPSVPQPGVRDLARFVAPAVRVERALLRAARRAFFPGADPGLESDLWFSDELVASRSLLAMTLRDEVRKALLAELAQVPRLLERVRALVERHHAHLQHAQRLEEEMSVLAVRGEAGDAERLEERLRQVVVTMRRPERKMLGRWAAEMMGRMPALPKAVEALGWLEAGLAVQRGGGAEGVEDGKLGWWLEGVGEAKLWVRVVERLPDGARLELSGEPLEGAEAIVVPNLWPARMVLRLPEQEAAEELRVERGGRVSVPIRGERGQLESVGGAVDELEWEVTPEWGDSPTLRFRPASWGDWFTVWLQHGTASAMGSLAPFDTWASRVHGSEDIGRALFGVLIESSEEGLHWAMEALTTTEGVERVDLVFERGAGHLAAVAWELMQDPEGVLLGPSGRAVLVRRERGRGQRPPSSTAKRMPWERPLRDVIFITDDQEPSTRSPHGAKELAERLARALLPEFGPRRVGLGTLGETVTRLQGDVVHLVGVFGEVPSGPCWVSARRGAMPPRAVAAGLTSQSPAILVLEEVGEQSDPLALPILRFAHHVIHEIRVVAVVVFGPTPDLAVREQRVSAFYEVLNATGDVVEALRAAHAPRRGRVEEAGKIALVLGQDSGQVFGAAQKAETPSPHRRRPIRR